MPTTAPPADLDPMGYVTVVREIRIKPGQEEAFQVAAQALIDRAFLQKGHKGVWVIRPPQPGGQYRVIYRFENADDLTAWHAHPDRIALNERLKEHILEEAAEVVPGFGAWLDLPDTAPKPKKWESVFASWLGIFPAALLYAYILEWINFRPNLELGTFLGTAIVVPGAAYLTVPHVSRALRKWLAKP